MREKVLAVLYAALESFLVGALIGVASVWKEPNDVILSMEGLKLVAVTGAQFGLVYLVAFLRQNRNL